MQPDSSSTDFTMALETLASEPALFLPSAPYWRRVWGRARRETGHYAIEVLTGLTGSSGLVLGIIIALYWWFGGWDDAKGYVVTIVYIAAAVFIGSFLFLFDRLVRLPPIMERESILEHRLLIQGLAGSVKDQMLEVQRLRLSLTRQALDNLSVLVRDEGRNTLLSVMNHGPDASLTATARVTYSSRPKQVPPKPYLLPWDSRRQSSAAVSQSAHADALFVGFDETHFYLWSWTPNGPEQIGNWYLNPILSPKEPTDDDPRWLELWVEITFSSDTAGVEPLVARFQLDVQGHSRDVKITRVATFEVPPPLGGG